MKTAKFGIHGHYKLLMRDCDDIIIQYVETFYFNPVNLEWQLQVYQELSLWCMYEL